MDSAAVVAFGIAALLGFRHALDPDHLVAVSTLIAGDEGHATRSGARLGLVWGAGHATTITLLGLPIVFAHAFVPETFARLAETAIGVIIVVLAGRLVRRWRRGAYHMHAHRHDGRLHSHVHAHRRGREHAHEHVRPRTPLQAYLIGATHGVGGSAPVTVLLLASVPDRAGAAAALVVFAAGTAASMGALSAAFAWIFERRVLRERLSLAMLPLGIAGIAFGAIYAVGAWLPAFGVV